MAEKVRLKLNDASYLYLCKHFTSLSEDERNHLVSIFSVEEVENNLNQIGSKFFNEFAIGPADLIDKLKLTDSDKVFIQPNGRKVSIFIFDFPIGITGLIKRTDIPLEFHDQIIEKKRGEAIIWVWETDKIIFTNQLVLITDNDFIITCFPGLYAPPFPSSKMTELELEEAELFWDQHIFIDYV